MPDAKQVTGIPGANFPPCPNTQPVDALFDTECATAYFEEAGQLSARDLFAMSDFDNAHIRFRKKHPLTYESFLRNLPPHIHRPGIDHRDKTAIFCPRLFNAIRAAGRDLPEPAFISGCNSSLRLYHKHFQKSNTPIGEPWRLLRD